MEDKTLEMKTFLYLPSFLSLSETKNDFLIVKKLKKFNISTNENLSHEKIVLFVSLLYLYRINGYNPYLVNFVELHENFNHPKDSTTPTENIFKVLLFLLEKNISGMNFLNFYEYLEGVMFKNCIYDRKCNQNESDLKFIEHYFVIYHEKNDFDHLIQVVKKDTDEKPRMIIGIKKNGSEICFYGNREIVEEERNTEDCMNKFYGHLETIIKSIGSTPTRSIPFHHVLTQEEYDYQYLHLVMNNFNEELIEKSFTTLNEIIESSAIKYHDKLALEMRGEKMTYDQFNRRVNQVGRYLKDVVGLKRGDFVCHLIEKSLECPIYFYATAKIGCIFLSQDHTYPREKRKYILEETKCQTVLLSSKFTDYYRQFHTSGLIKNLIEIESLRSEVDKMSEENIIMTPKIEPDDFLYIFFSSGSTGTPKGVLGEHLHALTYMFSNIHYLQRHIDLKDYLLFHKPVFVSFLLDMMIPIIVGCPMWIIPHEIRYDSQGLMKYLNDRKISFIDIPPSVLRFFPRDKTCFPYLTHLTYGGEALDEETRKYWMEEGGLMLGNSYGMTENTGTHLHFLEQGQSPCHLGLTQINYYSYVLDEFMQPVPIGCSGELYTAMFGIHNSKNFGKKYKKKKKGYGQTTTGYLNNKKMTDEKYVIDTFNPQLKTKLIKTGDLVRMYLNGQLVYLGRKLHDLRIRGVRIQLDRVEGEIKKHALVKDVVVIPYRGKVTNKNSRYQSTELIPFVVLNDDDDDVDKSTKQKEEEEKKAMRIERILLEYMVSEECSILELAIPKEVVIIKKYPLNFAGKISWKKMISYYEGKLKERIRKREEENRKNRMEKLHLLDLMLRKVVKEFITEKMVDDTKQKKREIVRKFSVSKSKFLKEVKGRFRKRRRDENRNEKGLLLDDDMRKEESRFRKICREILDMNEEEVEGED